ncbi:MAG TPA: DNA recombination protein RmuC, partial [Mycobacteriales bacterium]
LVAERDAVRAEADRTRADLAAVRAQAGAAEAELARTAAALDHQREGEQLLREAFASLSAEALSRNNEAFVRLAESRLRQVSTEATGDLSQRQQAIEGLVTPLRETLGRVEAQLRSVEKEREGAFQALVTQIGGMRQDSEQLRAETRTLVTALRAPQVRGRWGELQLRRVVEAAGMLEHCDFDEQATSSTPDGVLRPDLVVHLAGGKHVVVDSKVPFAGYLEAMEARDEATRADRRRAHARHLREHVDRLAAKAYWERFEPAPEFVVMFVPADTFLDAALATEPALLEHAFARNVVIATPSTLVALLRTVAYTWRQEALAHNAQRVLALGRELHNRLSTLGNHVDGLGRALNSAVGRYNDAVSSLESRVLVTARRFVELKVTDDDLRSPRQVESHARTVQAPVLVAGESVVTLPSGQHRLTGPVEPTDDATRPLTDQQNPMTTTDPASQPDAREARAR